jgi:hypothetical protein
MKTKFKFSHRTETLDIINTGGHLVEYLSKSSEICPLVNSEIKFIRELGKGEYGTAFLIKINGMGEKEYVAKVNDNKCKYINLHLDKDKTLRMIAEKLETDNMIPIKTFMELNGDEPEKIYSKGTHKFIYPSYAKMCLTTETVNYPKNNKTGEVIVVPKGSYVCDSESYSEYIIGILCGDLYRKGVSINFLDVFGFASCPQENKCLSKQYTFMEKAGDTLNNYIKKNKSNPLLLEVSYIQIVHAIGVYQKYYKLQHNDLHMSNILIEKVTPETIYQNKKVYEADWYHYKIYDTDIYLPKTNILIKIVDFGFSVKYSEPIVGNKRSLTKGLSSGTRRKPWIPNWYSESSDTMFMTEYFYSESPHNMFIENILGWMMGLPESNDNRKKINQEIKRGFVSGGDRPDVMLLEGEYSHGTPSNILQHTKLMQKYLIIPKKGKIVTLGIIE